MADRLSPEWHPLKDDEGNLHHLSSRATGVSLPVRDPDNTFGWTWGPIEPLDDLPIGEAGQVLDRQTLSWVEPE